LPVLVALPMPLMVIVPSPAPAQGGGSTGSGIGGAGSGHGTGEGTGSGTGNGPALHARQTHGHLSPGDVPDGVLPPGGSAAVAVRYVVGTDGRVSGCTVTAPSGIAQVDAVPCPLIERRFRFRPARDAVGQAVPETINETHTWFEPQRR
jgi:protein TonB